jgi:hypothetical protein
MLLDHRHNGMSRGDFRHATRLTPKASVARWVLRSLAEEWSR